MSVALCADDAEHLVRRHLERLAEVGREFAIESRGRSGLFVFPLRPLRERSCGTLRSEIETLAVSIDFRERTGGAEPLTDVHVHVTEHMLLMAGVLTVLDAVSHLGTSLLGDLFLRWNNDWELETLARNDLLSVALQPLGAHQVKASQGAYRRQQRLATA